MPNLLTCVYEWDAKLSARAEGGLRGPLSSGRCSFGRGAIGEVILLCNQIENETNLMISGIQEHHECIVFDGGASVDGNSESTEVTHRDVVGIGLWRSNQSPVLGPILSVSTSHRWQMIRALVQRE